MIYICIYLVRSFFLFLFRRSVGFSFVSNSFPLFTHSLICILKNYRTFVLLLVFLSSRLPPFDKNENKTKQNSKSIPSGAKMSTHYTVVYAIHLNTSFYGHTSVPNNLSSQVKYFKWLFASFGSFFFPSLLLHEEKNWHFKAINNTNGKFSQTCTSN